MPFGYFIPVKGGHPDQSLPGMEGEIDPGYGHDMGGIRWPTSSSAAWNLATSIDCTSDRSDWT